LIFGQILEFGANKKEEYIVSKYESNNPKDIIINNYSYKYKNNKLFQITYSNNSGYNDIYDIESAKESNNLTLTLTPQEGISPKTIKYTIDSQQRIIQYTLISAGVNLEYSSYSYDSNGKLTAAKWWKPAKTSKDIVKFDGKITQSNEKIIIEFYDKKLIMRRITYYLK
jgi:hypothetical protein